MIKLVIKRRSYGVVYVRVSTQKQVGPGHISLEVQEKMCKEFLEKKNIPLVPNGMIPDVVNGVLRDEGLSGTKLEGRGLWGLITNLHRHDYLVVYDISRLSRNVTDSLLLDSEFKKRGINFISVTQSLACNYVDGDNDISQNAERDLLKNIMFAVSEFEARKTSQKTSHAMIEKHRRGETCGRLPFGFRDVEGKLKEDQEEQEIILKIYLLREVPRLNDKIMSYKAIADQLNYRGCKCPADKVNMEDRSKRVSHLKYKELHVKWNQASVRNIYLRLLKELENNKEKRELYEQEKNRRINIKIKLQSVMNDVFRHHLAGNDSLAIECLKEAFPGIDFTKDDNLDLMLDVVEDKMDEKNRLDLEMKKKYEEEEKKLKLTEEINKFVEKCKEADDEPETIVRKVLKRYGIEIKL